MTFAMWRHGYFHQSEATAKQEFKEALIKARLAGIKHNTKCGRTMCKRFYSHYLDNLLGALGDTPKPTDGGKC